MANDINVYNFSTKSELLKNLQLYCETPDDDNILFKEKIKTHLLNCPELLYALHNKELESELFDSSGNLLIDGEWDRYFESGDNSGNIKPYIYIPETQAVVDNYVCYTVSFDEKTRYNEIMKYGLITFTVFVNGQDAIDKETGMPRHDLIASIIREYFNWTNIFGTQCYLVSDKEGITDNSYLTRTLIYQLTKPNSITKTTLKDSKVINNPMVRK